MHWQIKIFTTDLIRPVHCLHHVKPSRVIATILGCSRIPLVKYYIFSSTYKLQRPTINGFLHSLHQTREIEEHIVSVKDKLEVRRKKWQLLQIT